MWVSEVTERLERVERLDPVVDAVTAVATRLLPRGPVKDALHGRWLGHPVHPLLVALPIGLFSSASLLDVAGGPAARRAARRLVGAGVLAVAPTAASGLADWSELGDFRRPRRVGLVHASSNVLATLLYAASWRARGAGRHGRGRDLALAGMLSLSVGGYLGGHLSYTRGVGVNRNADRSPGPSEWTDAAAADALLDGDLHRVEVDGRDVLLARVDGAVCAIGATCSHFGGPLEDGDLVTGADACVVCPWHGSRFRLADGSVAGGPATAPQPGYDVRTVAGRIQVRARR